MTTDTATAAPYSYSVQEVADMLKTAPNTIRERIRDGHLRAIDLGSDARPKVRILATDLDTYLAARAIN